MPTRLFVLQMFSKHQKVHAWIRSAQDLYPYLELFLWASQMTAAVLIRWSCTVPRRSHYKEMVAKSSLTVIRLQRPRSRIKGCDNARTTISLHNLPRLLKRHRDYTLERNGVGCQSYAPNAWMLSNVATYVKLVAKRFNQQNLWNVNSLIVEFFQNVDVKFTSRDGWNW